MASFVLSYDLRNQRDYQPLWDELARFNAVRVLESLWWFERYQTKAAGLRDHFRQFLDQDDGLMVMEITDWATIRARALPKDAAVTLR
jgi:hypothetical protein